MATVVSKLVVDVAKDSEYLHIVAKQHDTNSRFIKVSFSNQGVPYDIPNGSIVRANYLREDGQAYAEFGEAENGAALVPVSSWALQNEGNVRCSVSVLGGSGELLTSTTFYMRVQPEEYAGDGEVPVYRTSGTEIAANTAYYIIIAGVPYSFTSGVALAKNSTINFSSDMSTAQAYNASGTAVWGDGVAVTSGSYTGTQIVGGYVVSMIDNLVQTAAEAKGAAEDGRIVEMYISNRHLICVLASGEELDAGIIPDQEGDEASEIDVPLYMVNQGTDDTVELANYFTYVYRGDGSALAVSLPIPTEGSDYVCGVIFRAITDFTFSVTPPSGYSIVWDGTPVWKANKIYELIFRCLWLKDSNSQVIISAKWGVT